MGRRSEPRVPIILRLKIHGLDENGQPFWQSAQTIEICQSGARLQGVHCVSRPGVTLELEYRRRKAKFIVVWVGATGSPEDAQVGLRSIDSGKNFWGIPLPPAAHDAFRLPSLEPPAPDPFAVVVSPPSNQKREEQRRWPRVSRRVDAQVCLASSSGWMRGVMTDIGLGGCYVEMMTPLPVGASVELILDLDKGRIHCRGVVRTSDAPSGMGITFADLSEESREQLNRIIIDAGG